MVVATPAAVVGMQIVWPSGDRGQQSGDRVQVVHREERSCPRRRAHPHLPRGHWSSFSPTWWWMPPASGWHRGPDLSNLGAETVVRADITYVYLVVPRHGEVLR